MRSDISIHTKLFLSARLSFPVRHKYLHPLSLTIRFPHTSFFYPAFTPNTHTIPLFSSLSLLSTLEYPVFHLAAQWAVWMCLVSYVTSFLESLPPAHCHCITCQLLCATQWGYFFSAFLRHKHDPLMEMALWSAESCPPPPKHRWNCSTCSRMTCYATTDAGKNKEQS